MLQIRILTIAGTRPEAIKLAPLVRELARRPAISAMLLLSGQHPTMASEALAEFDLAADEDLAVANPDMATFCTGFDAALAEVLPRIAPDLVLVQGDTNTAWVAALTATRLGFAVGHVEAGLRSGHLDLPWPEERNRQEIDAVSTLLFTPSPRATRAAESLAGRVFETGNTGIDALIAMLGTLPPRSPAGSRKRLFVTCHRREAIPLLPDLALALRTLADRPDVAIRMPLHPNPAIGGCLEPLLRDHPDIRLDPPLRYRETVAALAESDVLLTDSGGLQEEAPALGLPTLVLRATTERWEPIEQGVAKLVGLSPAAILTETATLLDRPDAYAAMARPIFPYGTGDAARRIADAIELWWAKDPLPFPWEAACSKGAGHGRMNYGDELDAG